ncbi:cystatin-1-like [Paramuricea clavata]|uniref:Cystatin-1-like n=1 Tax=Paramuricea clavata TaxID=317549 RepID=A0A7D9LBX3_PARCT|nr:cystatin-1-like [Paramuricea clavata]
MSCSLGKCDQAMCVVLMYILTLHSVMPANFGYNADVFEDEMIEYEKRQHGGQTAIPHDNINQYQDLLDGINKAEAEILNEDLTFDSNSLQVTSQVVQGTLYRVEVDVQPKSCSGSESCNVVKHCSFKIWSRQWLLLSEDEKLKIMDITCQ